MRFAKPFISIFLVIIIFLSLSFTLFAFLLPKQESKEDFKDEAQKEEELKNFPTVIIDAGHGGEDGGAIGSNGAYEKDINLSIAFKLKEKLESMGIPVIMTRTTDILLYDKNSDYKGKKKKLDLLERKKIAEQYENAIFISIHQNSCSKPQYSGFQTYYSPNGIDSLRLASCVEEWVSLSYDGISIRPSKKADSSIYLLNELYCPAILIECGFISNPNECALLCTNDYQNSLVSGISKAVERFIGITE